MAITQRWLSEDRSGARTAGILTIAAFALAVGYFAIVFILAG